MDSPLSQLGESRIDEAIADGSLQPPPPGTTLDLEGYFATPAAWRSTHSMLKSNGYLPPELESLKQAAELEQQLESVADPDRRRALRLRIEQLRVPFRLATERPR